MSTQIAANSRTKRTKAGRAVPSDPSTGRREGHLIGYARVSTTGQDTATQEAKLKAAGCTLIRTETVSGASRNGRGERMKGPMERLSRPAFSSVAAGRRLGWA